MVYGVMLKIECRFGVCGIYQVKMSFPKRIYLSRAPLGVKIPAPSLA